MLAKGFGSQPGGESPLRLGREEVKVEIHQETMGLRNPMKKGGAIVRTYQVVISLSLGWLLMNIGNWGICAEIQKRTNNVETRPPQVSQDLVSPTDAGKAEKEQHILKKTGPSKLRKHPSTDESSKIEEQRPTTKSQLKRAPASTSENEKAEQEQPSLKKVRPSRPQINPASATSDEPAGRQQPASLPIPAQMEKRTPTAETKRENTFEVFLAKIASAKSLDEVRSELNRMKLLDSQKRELGRMLSQAKYADKLALLGDQEKIKLTRAALKTPPDTKKRIELLKQERTEKHGARIGQMRAAVVAEEARLQRATSRVTTPAAAPAWPFPESAARSAHIESITPHPVRVGHNITVTGSGFGMERGNIMFLVGHTRGRHGDPAEADRILQWSDSRIVVSVPERAAPFVCDTDTQSLLWVKLAGGETGPTQEITLLPNYDLLRPEITHLSSTEIMPDQPVLVQGRNFLSSTPGRVELHISSHRFETIVESWSNDILRIVVPNIWGLLREPGWLVVSNHARHEARVPITFEPKLIIFDITTPGERGSFRYKVLCSPNWWGSDRDDIGTDLWPYLLCIFGERETYTTRMNLRNGWVLVDAWHELYRYWGWRGPYCGASYDPPPVFGRAEFELKNVIWVNAYNGCEFSEKLLIEGPRGVPYDKDYDPSQAQCR